MTPSSAVRIGIAGCGSIGARYAQWARELGAVVWVYDSVSARAERVGGAVGAQVCRSLEALIASGVEKVVVASPPRAHRVVACAALKADLDVLVEKPLAASLDDAEEIVAASRESSGRAWGVCNMRFHPGPETLKAELSRIGHPYFAKVYFGHRLSQMRQPGFGAYAGKLAEGGGLILDCIHEFDYLRWLLGPFKRLRAWQARLGEDAVDGADLAEIQLELNGGVHASIHLDFLSRRKRRGAEIAGAEGTLLWESDGKQPESCKVRFLNRDERLTLHSDPDLGTNASYKRMLETFMRGGEGLQTIEEADAVLRLALLAQNSHWEL